jgi:hypothetical protein
LRNLPVTWPANGPRIIPGSPMTLVTDPTEFEPRYGNPSLRKD